MAMADRARFPIAIYMETAAPHEVTLVEATLASRFVAERSRLLIGDRVYDSDPIDAGLGEEGTELRAPQKCNRKNLRPRIDAGCDATYGAGK